MSKTIAEMTDLERLLCFLHGAHYCGTRSDPEDLQDREYDHDFDNSGGSLITVVADTGAAAGMTHRFTSSGAFLGIHMRRFVKGTKLR